MSKLFLILKSYLVTFYLNKGPYWSNKKKCNTYINHFR